MQQPFPFEDQLRKSDFSALKMPFVVITLSLNHINSFPHMMWSSTVPKISLTEPLSRETDFSLVSHQLLCGGGTSLFQLPVQLQSFAAVARESWPRSVTVLRAAVTLTLLWFYVSTINNHKSAVVSYLLWLQIPMKVMHAPISPDIKPSCLF